MVPDRQRGSSLPEGREQKQESDLYRLRQFTVANKKIVQRSDSLQPRRSISSVHSSASRYDMKRVSPRKKKQNQVKERSF